MAATGWLRGTVKDVPSGDTLVLAGACQPGAVPAEKSITLSSLIAPRLARRDGTTKDEPFAWTSREFLRNLCIGQSCVFKIEQTMESTGRTFGSVFLDQSRNVAVLVASEGWAKLKGAGPQQSPFYEELKKAEEQARLKGLGMWTKDPDALAGSVRNIPSNEDFNALAFLQKVGKGRPVAAIVEAVLNGSLLRVCLLPEHQYVAVALCGVQCPSMGRRPTPAAGGGSPRGTPAEDASGVGENGENAPSKANPQVPLTAAAVAGGASQVQIPPEPFAREAKAFTEARVLSREVRLIIEGVDKFGNLFATVLYSEGDQAMDLAEKLTLAGLAKVVEWSLKMLTTGSMKLREAERASKRAKEGQWLNYVPQNTGQEKRDDKIEGKVIEVLSGDCIVVKDSKTGAEHRVNLSSIRAPRPAMRDRVAEPFGAEAKEFLRKKLVGHDVHILLEYTRKVQPSMPGDATGNDTDRVLTFGNVEMAVEKKGLGKENIGETLVKKGHASVIRHRSDEERSHVYEKLVAAEEAAKQDKAGIHSQKEQATSRLNDLSLPGSGQRAKQHLPFLQRAGKMQGVVEAVISAHRFKLYIPREGVIIMFSPSGVKSPARAQNASAGRPAIKGEPYAAEAYSYARETVLQRNVEIEVETVDRGGTFLGNLTILGAKAVNVGLALLSAGLAKLHPSFAPDKVQGGATLLAAQDAAKNGRLKVWEAWTADQDRAAEPYDGDGVSNGSQGAISGHHNGALQERQKVVVTDVTEGCDFYVQSSEEPRIAWLAEQLRQLTTTGDAGTFVSGFRVGQLCLGLFSQDGQWYRAYIERVQNTEPRYDVYFVDYGNRERCSSQSVRPIDSTLAAIPPQAQLCQLAHVKVPAPGSEYGSDAASLLASLVGGGRHMLAQIVAVERADTKVKHPATSKGKLLVEIYSTDGTVDVIQELLGAGLARLPPAHKLKLAVSQAAAQRLQKFEDEARQRHRGMFRYGDPGDSDDEKEAPGALGRRRR